MLQLGSSRPWQDALEVLTGQRYMDASGLLDYFKPLQDYLEYYNKKNNVYIGWEQPRKSKSATNVFSMTFPYYDNFFSLCVSSEEKRRLMPIYHYYKPCNDYIK